jgi:hypothetical protein
VRALYPKARVEPHRYDESGHYLDLTSADGRHAIRFETDGKVVTTIIVGEREPVGYVEGCL